MTTPEPCFRMYLGKSNWVNLSPKVTADLQAIYDQGIPTRYKLAPGLFIDILPHDVDCNSKTTELPNLMRADICYDEEGSPAERQAAAQQTLSRFVKAELESQGIVDAFPPNDTGTLPRVFDLSPHRHLGLVPTPPKVHKRNHVPVADPLKRKPPAKKQRRSKRRSAVASPTYPSAESQGKRPKTPSGYHLRSHDQTTSPHQPFSHPSKSTDTPPSFEQRTEFFPVENFENHNNNDRQLWYPPNMLQLRRQDIKNEGWDLYGFHPPPHQDDFEMYSTSASSSQFQPPTLMIDRDRYYAEYSHVHSFFLPPEAPSRCLLPISSSPSSPSSTH